MAPSSSSPPMGSPAPGTVRKRSRMAWVWRILYIVYSLEVGCFLLILPWWNIWDNNYFVYVYPQIRPVVSNPFLKGAVLGLGVVNIVIGIQELVLLWKRPRRTT
jgi:hypothetical protein